MNSDEIEFAKVLLTSAILNLVAPDISSYCKAELSAIRDSNFGC